MSYSFIPASNDAPPMLMELAWSKNAAWSGQKYMYTKLRCVPGGRLQQQQTIHKTLAMFVTPSSDKPNVAFDTKPKSKYYIVVSQCQNVACLHRISDIVLFFNLSFMAPPTMDACVNGNCHGILHAIRWLHFFFSFCLQSILGMRDLCIRSTVSVSVKQWTRNGRKGTSHMHTNTSHHTVSACSHRI